MYKPVGSKTRSPFPNSLLNSRLWRKIAAGFGMTALVAVSWATTAAPAAAGMALLQPEATIVVDTLNDLPDINPADGVCQTDANNCSLRAAIETAQGGALPGADTIDLSGLAGTIFLGSGVLPDIVEDLTINGPAVADALIINATGEHQHLGSGRRDGCDIAGAPHQWSWRKRRLD